MTDTERKRIEGICKIANINDIGDLSDGFHTFNGLYYQRMMLFAAIVKQNKDRSWKSLRHEDGELCFGGGWFVVGVDTPEGSYTYHYEDNYYSLFDCKELERGKHWDGHTEKDVTRLLSLPSVQPELNLDEWCTDCKEYDQERHRCPRWNKVIRQALAESGKTERRWSGLYSESDEEDGDIGKKLFEGDRIYLLGVEGEVRQEYGAWGWGSVNYVPWKDLEERVPHNNTPTFCYCDNFISFWELKWMFDDGNDWDGVPFIKHSSDTNEGEK